MAAKIVKNLLEIAIASIVTLILSLFLSIVGSGIGGIISYLIIKKANQEEIKGFKEAVVPLSLIAIISVVLFLIATSFFIRISDTLIGQIIQIDDLVAYDQYDKNENSIMLVISFVISVINISVFMLAAYLGSKIFR